MSYRRDYLNELGICCTDNRNGDIAVALLEEELLSMCINTKSFMYEIAKSLGKRTIPRYIIHKVIDDSDIPMRVMINRGEEWFKYAYQREHKRDFDKIMKKFIKQEFSSERAKKRLKNEFKTACSKYLCETYNYVDNLVI